MPKPLISLITATRRRPDFLRKLLLGMSNQELIDYEHVIVADHCEYSRGVYNEFKHDNRISFYDLNDHNSDPHMTNVGAIGKNFGLTKAKADLIAYCDDDCVPQPTFLSTFYQFMEEHPNIDVCFTKYYHIKTKNWRDLFDLPDPIAHARLAGHIDMNVCCHRKKLPNVRWKPQAETGKYAEDSILIHDLKMRFRCDYIDKYTLLYWAWGKDKKSYYEELLSNNSGKPLIDFGRHT